MGIVIIVAIVVAAYMAWNIGANDVANAMADAVGSKSCTIFWAIVLAAICNFAGAVLVGGHVTDTVRSGIIETQTFAEDPMDLAYGMLCALLAAALWLNLASILGMPVSTTHSIVGAIVGFGLLRAGFSHVHWDKLGEIVASWFISPLVGGILAFISFKIISRNILSVDNPAQAARKGVPICVFITFTIMILSIIYKGLKNLHLNLTALQAITLSIIGGLIAAAFTAYMANKKKYHEDGLPFEEQLVVVEKRFAILVVITSCSVAFAQGANDVANAIGPLAAVAEIVKNNTLPGKVPVDMRFLTLGGAGIAIGLATFGYRVMRVMGEKVTEITPSRGVAADLAGMTTVLVCSRLGLPISTTHTLVGAIIGVGLARGITAIDRNVVRSIFVSWLATVPIAAVLTIILYLLGSWLFF
ncbi:MAG: inorganic phosphate transporter [Phycisphaerae bacterium]